MTFVRVVVSVMTVTVLLKTKLTVGANSESNTTVYQSVRNVNREQRESLSV